MQFKDVQSFIRGIFEKDGVGARIADGFLTKLHNFDIDITGKVKQRRGYTYWHDLIEDHSVASALGIPDVINKTGFEKKIQTLYFYTDVAGIKHIIVIVDGKIFEEKLSASQRIWVCLNPSGDMDISEKTKYIDVKSYLDILFFNDYQKNVYMYNTRQYSQAGYVIAGNRLIYFAGDKIYFRDYSDFDTEYHEHAIIGVSRPGPPDDEFHIAGNYVHNFTVDDIIKVKLTGEVDYTDFTVTAIFYDIPNDETDIKVGVIPGAVTTGDLKSQYRILIEDNAVNFMGKAIFDSLGPTAGGGIDYIGNKIATAADLNLGYCIRIGNETTGYYYYVLSNSKNQVAADKCWLVKFDDRFIAQKFIEFPMDANGEVINFAYHEGFFYVWCKNGVIHKVDEDFAPDTITGDAAFLEGPTNVAGKKQYSIAVNDNGIFIYTDTLPDKSDWYQPIISEKELNLDSVLGASSPTQPTFPGGRTVNLQGSPEVLASKEVFSSLYDKWDSEFWWGDVTKVDKDAGFTLRSTEKGESLPANSIHMRAFHLDIKSSDFSDVVINADNTTRRYAMSYYITPALSDTIRWHGNDWVIYKIYGPPFDIVRIFDSAHAIVDQSDPGDGINISGTSYNNGDYVISHFNVIPEFTEVYIVGSFIDETVDPAFARLEPYGDLVRRSNIVDWTAQKVKYSTVFQYDKSLAALSDEILYTTSGGPPANTLDRRDDTFYLIGSTFNSNIFTSKTEPDYVLLVWLNFDGSMESDSFDTLDEQTKTIRYFFPLGKHGADLRNIVPLTIEDNELYFGTSMVDDPADEENGIYMKMNVSDFSYVTKKCQKSSQRYRIPGDSRWFLRGDADANFYRGAGTWEWDDGFDVYENYINLDTFGSNLVYHIYKVTGAMNGAANENLIQYLGTPKTLFLTMDNDSTSELIRETQLRYYMAFKMYSEKTTYLSAPTEAIEIPQLNSGKDFAPGDVTPGTGNINIVTHGYEDDDIVWFSGADLPDGLLEDTDYYILKQDDDNFKVSLTKGGSADTWGDAGTGTHTVLKMNQDVKIILSGLNLENIDGINIYKKEDVEEIQVYRAQLNYGESVWGDPIIVKSIGKDVDGNFDYSPFADETCEDNTQNYTYSPFTAANVFNYPVSDMEVHKNRLVLINRIDYENPNVIQYSDVDMADALPPDNLRPIESGDGDKLTAGISAGDYLFLFKEKHIYAILGDVYDGQLIDIDKKIGCPYKNMIIEYNNAVFFLNDHGVFILSEGRAQDLVSDRIKNYFDRDRDDSIDFETLGDNGFTSVDEDKKEIKFYVPQKLKGQTQTENNLVIIYNFKHNYFKTYKYKHNITQEADIKDLETNEFKKLISDYAGNIYEISKDKNDADNKILYIFRTKEFNLGTDLLKKNMKILKVHGKYLNNMVVTYWIDGQRQIGKIIYRKSYTGRGEAIIKIWNGGKANCIMVEISGEGLNDPPIEIDEILIGYVKAGGFR